MRLIGLAVVLTLSLVLAPLAVEAQQAGEIHRVGYLGYDAAGSDPSGIAGLRQGLRDLGYIEGQNIVIEYRFAEGRPERLRGLIANHPTVINEDDWAIQAFLAAFRESG